METMPQTVTPTGIFSIDIVTVECEISEDIGIGEFNLA